ncbi:MAG: orotidine-5'-phosphate decarboxylase [Chloroflexi bacterium]|nr:orotidine-5'-phosphate decarboxylase [Chloroflexota bacterium]
MSSDKLRNARQRIIVPLDVSSEKEALDLVATLRDYAGYFKVGLELLTSVGTNIIAKIHKLGGQVFYDGKFNDIPNTVGGASRAVTRLGVAMFTVHSLGGFNMMKQSVESTRAESQITGIKSPLVLAVTILTSIDQGMMNKEMGITGTVDQQVVHLAKLAERAGVDAVVASPQEIEILRNSLSSKTLIITPGVRPLWAEANDQKRVMTPAEAISRGAHALVIGRPIIKPPVKVGSPADAIKLIAEEIASVLPD